MLGTSVGWAAKKRVQTSLSRPLVSVDLVGADLVLAIDLVAFVVVDGSVILVSLLVRGAGVRDVRVIWRGTLVGKVIV